LLYVTKLRLQDTPDTRKPWDLSFQILRYIGQYVSTCDLCLWTKPARSPPIGELHPLQILDKQWDTLSIDFVVELLTSSRFNAVMIVVDLVSKRAHFLLIHTTVTAERAARLFFHCV